MKKMCIGLLMLTLIKSGMLARTESDRCVPWRRLCVKTFAAREWRVDCLLSFDSEGTLKLEKQEVGFLGCESNKIVRM